MNKLVISLKESNDLLRSLGLAPFPIESVECDPNNPDEVDMRIKELGDQLLKWVYNRMREREEKGSK